MIVPMGENEWREKYSTREAMRKWKHSLSCFYILSVADIREECSKIYSVSVRYDH